MPVANSLTDGLWRLDLGYVNAYLVDDGTVTLIDAGTPRSAEKIRAGLDEAGYTLADVDRVLVTHFDIDHTGGLASLGVDVPLYAMEPDASMLTGERKPPVANHKGLFQRVAGLVASRPSGPVTRIGDEEVVGEFVAHHAPGHTPGHTVYQHPPTGAAFLGDLVRGTDGTLGMLPWIVAYDNSEVRENIQRLAGDLDFAVACPGHGDPVPSGGDDALTAVARR